MRILAIHNSKNSPGHGNDADGAFIPEAINFAKHHQANGHTVVRMPWNNLLPPEKRPAEFLGLIETAQSFDAFAYFGHGLRNSLSSANISGPNRTKLARLLAKKAVDPKAMIVTLYACSTGETSTKDENGEGGFADKLRDDLIDLGMTSGHVDGHTCAAHTTMNPYVRRFLISPAHKDVGGSWLVEPKSPSWNIWKVRLSAPWRNDPFRFDFPYLTAEQIAAAVAKG